MPHLPELDDPSIKLFSEEITMKKLITVVAAAAASLGLAVNAQAEYPTGPVQFIVPWPPGDF